MRITKDRAVTYLMCYTFAAPYGYALARGYFPEGYRLLLTAAIAAYAFAVHFGGFFSMHLYAKLSGYRKPEYDSDRGLADYIEKRRVWPALLAGLAFGTLSFLVAHGLHSFYNEVVKFRTDADSVGVVYEIIFAVWGFAVPLIEGIFWFVPDELFLPNEPSVLYWILPAIVSVVIPVVIFSANFIFPLACLLVFYVLHYFRRAADNRRRSEEDAERRKAEDFERNRHNY